ncbi:MAG: hypothetical protein CMH83_21510 [Nocardioides sp.]|nr:hypothetical protein [Nocardioides sp.]
MTTSTTTLRALREQRRIDHRDVADTLGVHPTTVLRWERGERLPGPTEIRLLAAALDVDHHEVVTFFDAVRRERDARDAAVRPEPGIRARSLRPLRRAAGVSARDLAARLGVPASTVYNWETGRARVPAATVAPLAAELGVPRSTAATALAAVPAPTAQDVAPPLRRFRHRCGLSQVHVARRIGFPRHAVSAWEHGATPPLVAVRRLAGVYGVPVTRLARAAGVVAPPLLDPARWQPGDLPQALVTLRHWCGLTQADLATRLGRSKDTVWAWESGRWAPPASARADLERVFCLPRGSFERALPTSSAVAGTDDPTGRRRTA